MNTKTSATVLLLTALTALSSSAQTTSTWGQSLTRDNPRIDTWNRAEVLQHFRDQYVSNYWLPMKHTGGDFVAGTTPGVPDANVLESRLQQLNCIRELVGVRPVVSADEPEKHENALWAAFVQVNGWATLGAPYGHNLTGSEQFWSEAASDGSYGSLLGYNFAYPSTVRWADPIYSFMWEGRSNTDAGHLWQMLNGDQREVAFGYGTYLTSETPSASNYSVTTLYLNGDDEPTPVDADPLVNFEWACPSEGYFPKGFIPPYWVFTLDGWYSTATTEGDARLFWTEDRAWNPEDVTVTVTMDGAPVDVEVTDFGGGRVVFSLPFSYDMAEFRGDPLRHNYAEYFASGDVVFEVSITAETVKVSDVSLNGGWFVGGEWNGLPHEPRTYAYTVVAMDWPDETLTYQVFPDERQIAYNIKWNDWLGWYYTYGDNWVWSWELCDWYYIYDAGNFGRGGDMYSATTSGITWDIPSVEEAAYSFYAYESGTGHYLWVEPTWFPWAWDYNLNDWKQL